MPGPKQRMHFTLATTTIAVTHQLVVKEAVKAGLGSPPPKPTTKVRGRKG